MCLITEQKKAMRTKEDMIVWKVMNGVESPYQGFVYEQGILYKTNIKKDYENPCWADEISRKAYVGVGDLVISNAPETSWKEAGYVSIGEGFHSCISEERALTLKDFFTENIRSFLIPAGSLIYKDRTGLVVSNQIMMLPEENH